MARKVSNPKEKHRLTNNLGGYKRNGKVNLSSEKMRLLRGKLRVTPMDNKGGSPNTLHKKTSSPSAKDKIK